MQFHLLTVVGNGVGVVLVATFADEIAVVVISAEESDEMREHLVFRAIGSICQCRFHLREQFKLQEMIDVCPLLIHDAIDAEIQFRMIHHEYLLQFLDETFVIIGCHNMSFFLVLLGCPSDEEQVLTLR